MVIGTLALLWYFVMAAVMGAGQRLWREPEETKSFRTGGISMSVHMSVCPSPPGAPQRLAQASQGTDGWTDLWTYRFPLFCRTLPLPVPSGAAALLT